MARKLSNEDLQAAFDQCQKNGTADEWDTLGNAYNSMGYVLNAGFCFKKADEIRAQQVTPELDLVNVTLKNRVPLAIPA